MSDNTEAMRLANALENLEATGWGGDCFALTDYSEKQAELAAAELRRLHAENEALREANNSLATAAILPDDKMIVSRADYAELVGALRRLIDMDVAYRRGPVVEEAVEKARAALAKVEKSK